MKPELHTPQEMEHRLRGPAYRWAIAERRAGSHRYSWTQDLDEPTRQAVAYLRCYDESGPERAAREYPTVAAACALRRHDESFQALKICLLGALASAEIAARLGVGQDGIKLAEALFFDIRATRDASAWMRCHVFLPEVKAGAADAAAKMKLAHHGGPATTRALLDAAEGLPLDEARRLVDQEILLHGKLQAALEFELDARTAPEFLKTYLQYNIESQKLELEGEKFRHACQVDRQDPRPGDVAYRDDESPGETPCQPAATDHDSAAADSVRQDFREQLVA